MTDDLIGKRLGGYEIVERIGQGGMATVYRAHQLSMNRMVAIKVLPRHLMNDDSYLQRFNREVRIVAQLEHRSIVPVYDYGEFDSQPFIVMRYMIGGSLDDLLQQRRRLRLSDILTIVEQIAPALDFAHSNNILHRDLKPSNVLLDGNGGAYITDFGIARILGESGGTITTQGVVGTPAYMSPEQAQAQALDGRSDIYSLGVMLFEMATGRRPFESETPYSIAVMQVTKPPPAPRSLNPEISSAFEHVLLTALKKKRYERYPNGAALTDALRYAAGSQPSLPDTQPNPVQPALPAAQMSPPLTDSMTVTPASSVPLSRVPPPSQSMATPLPVARRSRGNLLLNALVGVLIGCGLLTGVVVVIALLVSNNEQQQRTADQTATAVALAATEAVTADPVTVTVTLAEAVPTQATRPATVALSLSDTPAATRQASATAQATASVTPEPAAAQVDLTADGTEAAAAPVGAGATPIFTPVYTLLDGARGRVVFTSERGGDFNIYSLDLESGIVSLLTESPLTDLYPALSPDGEFVVFQSDRDGDFDIYLMEDTGINTRRLVVNRVTDWMPSWSPDGDWIVFASDTRGDGGYDLYRVQPTGMGLELLYSNGDRSSHPRYSPDGDSIVFVNGDPFDANTWEIGLLDLETFQVRYITENRTKDWAPVFTPDGEHIIYLTEGVGFAAIAMMDLNGGNQRTLFDSGGYESSLAVSADGNFVIFTNNEDGKDELFLMTIDGEQVRQLTVEGGAYPGWVVPS